MDNDSEAIVASDLVHRIQKGDILAEDIMVRRYQKGLLFMLRRKSNYDIADEVSQETWRIVIEKARNGAISKPAKLAAFIVQVGRNQLIMYFRRNENSGADDSSISQESNEPGPIEAFRQNQIKSFVRQLLRELATSRDREILARFYLQEEEKSDICRDLNLSDLHFNRVLHRAKKRLKTFAESLHKEVVP